MVIASNADLPTEVIHEILLRLPVKTLVRFKRVCKQWCTLIGSQTFVKQHFGHKNNHDCLLIRHYKPNQNYLTSTLYSDELGFGYEEPDYPEMPDGIVTLVGPLNGVFCALGGSGHLALFNPAIRQFRPIPSYDLNVSMNGFGLDPFSGDYTVISTLRENPRHVSIYSSGSDSWRHIENVNFVDKLLNAQDVCSTCLDGVHYWITWKEDDGDAIIIALDCSANFQEIQLPDSIKYVEEITLAEYGDSIALTLAIYGDSIALLLYDLGSTDQCVNVWVMKEVGCWTRSCTLGPIEGLDRPICSWKNTELVLLTDDVTSLTLCNVSTGTLRAIEVRRREGATFVYSYKESLVSIKREGENCKLWILLTVLLMIGPVDHKLTDRIWKRL